MRKGKKRGVGKNSIVEESGKSTPIVHAISLKKSNIGIGKMGFRLPLGSQPVRKGEASCAPQTGIKKKEKKDTGAERKNK